MNLKMPQMRPMIIDNVDLPDGLYHVQTSYLCAGFIVKDKKVIRCAPILKKHFDYYLRMAIRIGDA